MSNGETVSAESNDVKSSGEASRTVRVRIDRKATRQVITAFGGNFAVARFGDRDAYDSVGTYVMTNLPVGHARVGIPLKTFIKLSGDNYDAGNTGVKDVYRLLETLRDRKIPVIASVWDVPDFCLTDPEATTGRRIAPDKRDKVIAAVAEWLRLAREKHGCTIPYVSFHEPDAGILSIPPDDARYFITRGGTAIQKTGLPTKWILGDTATGESLPAYITAIMADKSVVPYTGPVSFHASDSLTAPDDAYLAVAKAARLYRKPVWCLEAGYDPQTPEGDPPVWETWDHALKLAHSYVRCLTLAEASVMDYWQYQNDRPIVTESEGSSVLSPSFRLFPSFHLLKLFAETFPPDTQILSTQVIGDGIHAVVGLESEEGKLRVLLVNTGEPADVIVVGGQPKSVYGLMALNEKSATTQQSNDFSEPFPALLDADEKGTVVVTMIARSVSALMER